MLNVIVAHDPIIDISKLIKLYFHQIGWEVEKDFFFLQGISSI